MITLEWDIEPALTALRRLALAVRDLRPAWASVFAYLRLATEQTFSTQGGRIGEPWQPLSERYARWKERHYPGMPILRASDEMFRSLIDPAHPNTIAEAEPQMLRYGTRDRKAAYHQKGGGRLPRRKILAVTESDRREVARIVRLHLENVSRASGFRPVSR